MSEKKMSLQTFLQMYQNLSADNLDQLSNYYTEDVHFIDPAHEIRGLGLLSTYFAKLYQNINSITFTFTHALHSGSEGYVQWLMTFSHRRLKKGQTISVSGASYLRFSDSGKVCFHRDFFDLGAMLYEQLPLLGKIITTIKRKMSS